MLKKIKWFLFAGSLFFCAVANALSTAEIKQLAEEGNALAQAKMAALYILGRNGVEKDYQQAAEWMKKAAEQGLVEAQVALAAMYDTGMGMQGDRNKATAWYEKAAKQKHGTAMAILGKNPVASGGIKFSYQAMRLNASKSIPKEYSKRFLMKKINKQ